MSLSNKLDIDFKSGESRTFRVTITDETNTLVDLTGATVKMTVVDNVDTPTTTIAKTGTILTQSGDTLGQADIDFIPSDTSGLARGEYFYDIRVLLASGEIHTAVCPSSFFIVKTITTFP